MGSGVCGVCVGRGVCFVVCVVCLRVMCACGLVFALFLVCVWCLCGGGVCVVCGVCLGVGVCVFVVWLVGMCVRCVCASVGCLCVFGLFLCVCVFGFRVCDGYV